MRIAVFSNSFPVLSETFIINQIVGLIKLGVEVDIITNEILPHDVMHSSVKDYSLLEQVKCIGINSKISRLKKIRLTAFNIMGLIFKGKLESVLNVVFDKYLTINQKFNLISALKVIKNETIKYDNVICHFGVNGYYVCKMRDLGLISGPISTVFHGFEISHYATVTRYLPQYKQLFVKGDLMLPISELWEGKLIEWGCEALKIKVHRMGIDVNDFELRDSLSTFSLPLKIIQVGRLTEKKAVLDSIKAVAISSKEFPVELNVIGEGELFVQAKDLIESLGAEKYIHLLGQQPQNVVKQYLNEADVFLLPSVRSKSGDMEGIPVALMEAMAKGLIVVSTYHSGIPELIENEISGYLVKEHDINELVTCLAKIQALPQDKITEIRISARSICLEKYNNDTLNYNVFGLFKAP
ncbi:glycosyltransferase [Colwellia sp. 12G3]|uniref:glycosyltransferase n=1 Tax=Colwellia sp. 12G3 TaxID=2058299 RepID=UPI000C324A2B|nr:glycosyltransferase [Colwellia sp. 12G3]PKI17448.1 colanic acid biosynthesis glycosyltransferase WcaL [Colwellia sp. 12G3]